MIAVLLVAGLLVVFVYGIRLALEGSRWFGLALVLLSVVGVPLVLFPESANQIANAVGVGRGADLLVYILFFVVIMLILVIHALLGDLNRRFTLIVRNMALSSPLQPDAPPKHPEEGSQAADERP